MSEHSEHNVMNWRPDPSIEPLADGTRGAGERRGEVGLADFAAGTYPACSLHGALVRVGQEPRIWRCLVEGCNAGAIQNDEGPPRKPGTGLKSETLFVYSGGQRSPYFTQWTHAVHDRTSRSVSHA